MAGRSRLTATAEQRDALAGLASGADRPQADRARAILLTLSGWTRPRIAEAFGVQENTVHVWRSALSEEIERREGVRISGSQLSKVLRAKGCSATGASATR